MVLDLFILLLSDIIVHTFFFFKGAFIGCNTFNVRKINFFIVKLVKQLEVHLIYAFEFGERFKCKIVSFFVTTFDYLRRFFCVFSTPYLRGSRCIGLNDEVFGISEDTHLFTLNDKFLIFLHDLLYRCIYLQLFLHHGHERVNL